MISANLGSAIVSLRIDTHANQAHWVKGDALYTFGGREALTLRLGSNLETVLLRPCTYISIVLSYRCRDEKAALRSLYTAPVGLRDVSTLMLSTCDGLNRVAMYFSLSRHINPRAQSLRR